MAVFDQQQQHHGPGEEQMGGQSPQRHEIEPQAEWEGEISSVFLILSHKTAPLED